MSTNDRYWQREYMKRRRAEGSIPTNWRRYKKENSVSYKFFEKFLKIRFFSRKQKYGRSMSKTRTIGLALGPIYLKMGYSPALLKRISESKWNLL